jgi:hypothetical protein
MIGSSFINDELEVTAAVAVGYLKTLSQNLYEGLRKPKKIIRQISRSLGQDSNTDSPE